MTCQPLGLPRNGPPRRIVQSDKDIIFFYGQYADGGGGQGEYRIMPTDGRKHNPNDVTTTYYGLTVGQLGGRHAGARLDRVRRYHVAVARRLLPPVRHARRGEVDALGQRDQVRGDGRGSRSARRAVRDDTEDSAARDQRQTPGSCRSAATARSTSWATSPRRSGTRHRRGGAASAGPCRVPASGDGHGIGSSEASRRTSRDISAAELVGAATAADRRCTRTTRSVGDLEQAPGAGPRRVASYCSIAGVVPVITARASSSASRSASVMPWSAVAGSLKYRVTHQRPSRTGAALDEPGLPAEAVHGLELRAPRRGDRRASGENSSRTGGDTRHPRRRAARSRNLSRRNRDEHARRRRWSGCVRDAAVGTEDPAVGRSSHDAARPSSCRAVSGGVRAGDDRRRAQDAERDGRYHIPSAPLTRSACDVVPLAAGTGRHAAHAPRRRAVSRRPRRCTP